MAELQSEAVDRGTSGERGPPSGQREREREGEDTELKLQDGPSTAEELVQKYMERVY